MQEKSRQLIAEAGAFTLATLIHFPHGFSLDAEFRERRMNITRDVDSSKTVLFESSSSQDRKAKSSFEARYKVVN